MCYFWHDDSIRIEALTALLTKYRVCSTLEQTVEEIEHGCSHLPFDQAVKPVFVIVVS